MPAKTRSTKPMAKGSLTRRLPIALDDPAVVMFRREAAKFLSTNSQGQSIQVDVVSAYERRFANGHHESLALCKAGEEAFTMKLHGEKAYFPRPKRLRGVDEDDDDEYEHAGDIDDGQETETEERLKAKKVKKSRVSKSKGKTREPPATPQVKGPEPATPVAPKKKRETNEQMRKRVAEALNRGGGDGSVRHEDDLASLCGGVGGLDVKSQIETESDAESAVRSLGIGPSTRRAAPHNPATL